MKIRSLHPSFFSDAKVCELSHPARLLFAGLWCFSDDYGRGQWLPKSIEGELFPREDVDIDSLLSEVSDAGLIRQFSDGSDIFYEIPSWDKYQSPKYRAKTPVPDPAYLENPYGTGPGQFRDKPGPNPVESSLEFAPGEGEGVLEERETHTVRGPILPGHRALDVWEEVTGTQLTRSERAKDGTRAAEFLQASTLSPDSPDFRAFAEFAHSDGTWAVGGWGRAWAKYRARRGETLTDEELQRRYEAELATVEGLK